jgi:hypothetical protein
MKKIYIAGPMTGLPDYNYPAFHAAEKVLASSPEWIVLNPAKNFAGRQDLERPVYLNAAIEQLLGAQAIYMLPGWQNSPGARMEYMIAKELELELHGDIPIEPPEYEASRIVRNGERQAIYGHPNQDFKRTAGMWSALLDIEITPEDVALMMGMLKISRLRSSPGHKDSIIDLIGYAICYSRLEEIP